MTQCHPVCFFTLHINTSNLARHTCIMSIDVTNFYKRHSIVTLRFILFITLYYITLHFAVFILKGSESCQGVWIGSKSIRGCWIQMERILQNITYAYWASTEPNGGNCLLMYQIDRSMFADDNCKQNSARTMIMVFSVYYLKCHKSLQIGK